LEHALAKANNSNADQGPVLKVRESADQFNCQIWCFAAMEGLGQSEQMGAASSPGERETGQVVSKQDRDIHRLMDKPSGCRLAIKEAPVQLGDPGVPIQRVVRWPEMSLRNSKVASELMSTDTGSGRLGRLREIRKETSECEVRAVLIWTKSTMGSDTLYTAIEVLCLITLMCYE